MRLSIRKHQTPEPGRQWKKMARASRAIRRTWSMYRKTSKSVGPRKTWPCLSLHDHMCTLQKNKNDKKQKKKEEVTRVQASLPARASTHV